MTANTLCQMCKAEESIIEIPVPLCSNPEGSKHRVNVCNDCCDLAKTAKCAECGAGTEQSKEENKGGEGVLAALADTSRCFLCRGEDDVIAITVKSCHTKEHDIPCCTSCVKKLSDSQCPMCTELNLGARKTLHLLIFHHDIVLVAMVHPGASVPKWTAIVCVEAVATLNFITFPQQAACVALESHAFHALFTGGYEADLENLSDKCAPSTVKSTCYYLHFSGFDYLTLDEAPPLNSPRFLHQAVGYYDQTAKKNIVYAIGGLCYKGKKKVWMNSCEVWGLNSADKWEKGPTLNSARADFSAGIVGDLIYVIGGFTEVAKLVTNNIEVCKIKGDSWQVLKVEGPARFQTYAAQSTCTNEDGIWIFGGSDGRCVNPIVFHLDLKTKSVTEKNWMKFHRAAALCGCQDGMVFLTAGYGAKLHTERFNTKKDEWEIMEENYDSIGWMLDEDSTAARSEHVMSTKMAIMGRFV